MEKKISLLTKEQTLFFNQVGQDEFLSTNFYFTGGTALSAFYLKHRYSEDMDFFSTKEFDRQQITSTVASWSKKYHFTFDSQFKGPVMIFMLTFPKSISLKVDFGYYPHSRVEKGRIVNRVEIDSLLDIAINKLVSIKQRAAVKDYVDLYFLLSKFTIWDLIHGARIKFRMEIEPWILSADLVHVDEFSSLPRMISPLTLEQLKNFYWDLSEKLAKRVVE